MEYSKLGNTDIEVSKLCVGCMSFGKAGTMHDWTLDKSESEKIIKHALNLGYNFFDTANGYSAGTSEEYLGRALKKNIARDQVVIASKVYFNEGRLSIQAIMREIDGSLSAWCRRYDLYCNCIYNQCYDHQNISFLFLWLCNGTWDGRYLDGHSGRSDIKIFIRVNSFQTGEMDENTYLKDEGENPKQSNLLTNVIKCV